MLYKELTDRIIGVCFQVMNEMGVGFVESVYHRALVIALQQAGLQVTSQQAFAVSFRGQTVGEFRADLVVDGAVLLELKAVAKILPEHKAQAINYLKASGLKVALLINFGNAKVEHYRLEHPDIYQAKATGKQQDE